MTLCMARCFHENKEAIVRSDIVVFMKTSFWIVASLLKLGNCHSVRYDVCSVDVKSGKLTLRDKVPPTQWPTLLAVTHMLFISSLFLVVPLSQPPFLCSLCIPLRGLRQLSQ